MKGLLTKKQKRQLISVVLTLIFAGGVWVAQKQGWIEKPVEESAVPIQQTDPGYYQVSKFEDGDTITVNLNGKNEKIRLIGVDTPETKDPRKPVQCFGQLASDFTKSLIGTSQVRLAGDPTNSNRDKYDRLLRYVYLPDGRLVNAEIIKQGYGFAYITFPFQKMDEFKNYEKQAREQSLGLWGACELTPNSTGGFTPNAAD